jgi:hypothetical protein
MGAYTTSDDESDNDEVTPMSLENGMMTMFGQNQPPTKGPPTKGAPTKGPPTKGAPTKGPPTKGAPTKGPPTKGPPTKGPPTKRPSVVTNSDEEGSGPFSDFEEIDEDYEEHLSNYGPNSTFYPLVISTGLFLSTMTVGIPYMIWWVMGFEPSNCMLAKDVYTCLGWP